MARAFVLRFGSYRFWAQVEALVVACVFAGVIAVAFYLVQMPGPLVVHVQDDRQQPLREARVRCTSPDGSTSYAGMTDVFGEAKWPGLAKGPWRCEVTPPARFFAASETGIATVVARHPAGWVATFERPARLLVEVARPKGAPRAKVALRAVCGGQDGARDAGAEGHAAGAGNQGSAGAGNQGIAGGQGAAVAWEARAGLLDGRAVLWIPHGAACRAGLVRAELPGDGPATNATLDCASEPCTAPLTGGVGEQLEASLAPTAAQWEAVRPPPEPDK